MGYEYRYWYPGTWSSRVRVLVRRPTHGTSRSRWHRQRPTTIKQPRKRRRSGLLPITIFGNVTLEATGRSEVTAGQVALENAQREYDNAVHVLRSAEATNARAQSDLQRYAQLLQKQEVAQSDYDQYEARAKTQQATVDADKASVAVATKTIEQRKAQLREQQDLLTQSLRNATHQVAIQRATLESRQAAESSAAKLDQAKLNLGYTHIVSPVDGIVTERSAEVGAQVSVPTAVARCAGRRPLGDSKLYMQPIPASVTAAMNSRARAVLSKKRQNSGKTSEAMHPNAPSFPREDLQVLEKNGSSGRTRTYNPPVNSRMLCH